MPALRGLRRSTALSTAIVWLSAMAALALVPLMGTLAQAQNAPPSADLAERCPGLVANVQPRILRADFRTAALSREELGLTFVGHSTFLLESAEGVRIATDYNDYVRAPGIPDIVTMNRAHSTHYTDHPEPGIKFVLRGWDENGKPADHDVTYRDVRVRNVVTNIRDWSGGTLRNGNSIFIFEVAQLCIAHLGHLHHTLTQQQINAMGRVDVVLVPVDGSYTLDIDGMVEVLRALKAPLMVPMHYFSRFTLDRFLDRIGQDWDVEWSASPSMVLSKASLPPKPKVLVLPGR